MSLSLLSFVCWVTITERLRATPLYGMAASLPSCAMKMTREICGDYFKLVTDKDLFAYFRTHYRYFFPQLTDRTLFVRQRQPSSFRVGSDLPGVTFVRVVVQRIFPSTNGTSYTFSWWIGPWPK